MAHLIYQTAFIGDLLLTTPLIRELRKSYPNDELHLACRKGGGELFLKLGLVDQVFEVNKSDSKSRHEFEKKLLSRTYDTVVCAHESLRSQFLMLRLKARLKIGYFKWYNGFVFHQRVQRRQEWPEALRLMSLLAPISSSVKSLLQPLASDKSFENSKEQSSILKWPAPIPQWLEMSVVSGEKSGAQKVSLSERKKIIIAPGSVWATKQWREEHFVELILKLIEKNHFIFLTGSAQESALCKRIEESVQAQLKEKSNLLVNISGQTTLFELFQILTEADLLIANDSAPIHLAAMAQTATVAIFGPTTLSLGYRPWSHQARVAQVPLSCRPCGAHGHKECPIRTHDCMKLLTASEVLRVAGL